MKNYTAHFLLVLAALLPCAAYAAKLSPSAVLYSANQYNGQEVKVEGIISHLKLNTTNDGTPYETFKICDGGACLDVYALGADKRTEGEQVVVKGHFWMLVQRGYKTFHNELDLDTDAQH